MKNITVVLLFLACATLLISCRSSCEFRKLRSAEEVIFTTETENGSEEVNVITDNNEINNIINNIQIYHKCNIVKHIFIKKFTLLVAMD